jgi:hypothetical protein
MNVGSWAACADEIRSAATHVTTEYSQVLCVPCAENPASHAVAYPGCPAAKHRVYDHPVVVGARLIAHRWLLRLRRVEEVAPYEPTE